MNFFKEIYKISAIAVLFLVLTAGTSFGTPVTSYWDVKTAGLSGTSTDTDTLTSLFDQILYEAHVNTIQYDTDGSDTLTVGDEYLSDANVIATQLSPISGNDTEGMNINYEFTFVMTDLKGIVSSITENILTTNGTVDFVTNQYTDGKIDMYIDATMNSDFNGTLDLGDDAGFGLGVHVATIEGITGDGVSMFTSGTTGSLTPQFITGAYDISGTFTYLLPNFWFDDDGVDLILALEATRNPRWIFGTADGNIDDVEQEFYVTNETPGQEFYTINSDSNASFEINAVPEPMTMTLLGLSFFGLGIFNRKKLVK